MGLKTMKFNKVQGVILGATLGFAMWVGIVAGVFAVVGR